VDGFDTRLIPRSFSCGVFTLMKSAFPHSPYVFRKRSVHSAFPESMCQCGNAHSMLSRKAYGGACIWICLISQIHFIHQLAYIHRYRVCIFFLKTWSVHFFPPERIWRGMYLYVLNSKIHFIHQLTYIHTYGVLFFSKDGV